jgi:hypothetical protein
MIKVLRVSLVLVGILLVSLPISFVLTLALIPLWSLLEDTWGIEAIGHSGPAEWCHLTVLVMVTTGLLVRQFRRR